MDPRRTTVGTFDLPHGEGEVDIMVDIAVQPAWLKHPLSSTHFLFHKPFCHGPMRVVKITDHKMVLACTGCNVRIELLVDKFPETLGDLGEALHATCRISDLPERAS